MNKPIIKTAEFVISNSDVRKCPQDGKPEYAFIGRSNVGKPYQHAYRSQETGDDIRDSRKDPAHKPLYNK